MSLVPGDLGTKLVLDQVADKQEVWAFSRRTFYQQRKFMIYDNPPPHLERDDDDQQ